MNYETISDIFAKNDQIRERLVSLVNSLDEDAANTIPDGEKWSAAMIVEHVCLVGGGMARICRKLLERSKAEGAMSDGKEDLGEFARKATDIADLKLEAPEIVQPKQGLSLAESLSALEQNRLDFQDLKPLFEEFDAARHTFPHPFLGELTALEWLAMAGAHEARHLRQIRKLLKRTGRSVGSVDA